MEYKQNKNESWDDYVWRMIEDRQELDLEHDELYERLYSSVIQDLSASLNKSTYPEKTNAIAFKSL